MTVADPDAAAETAARTGQEGAARDDRPRPRVPRRAWPAMVHRSVLSPVAASSLLRWSQCRPVRRRPVGSLTYGTSGVVTGMFGRLADRGDDPSVRGGPVLAPTSCGDRRRRPE